MKAKQPQPSIEIEESILGHDFMLPLSKLIDALKVAQKKYGKHAMISMDAGYNNVTPMITPTKKMRR